MNDKSLGLFNPNIKVVTGYAAMNKGELDIENMSFFKKKVDAKKFMKGQKVSKVKIIIS